MKERNPKWLNDLYVKFIRLSSHLIEKNGEGVLGFITNHGYLDNPTFRGMRWHLLKTFDKIWVLDLHGNAKKKEVTPEGKPDKNVFDIQQGVAIIIGVRKKDGGQGLAQVRHGDLWGERTAKYAALQAADLTPVTFSALESPAPQHPLVRRSYSTQEVYEKGISVAALMPVNCVGIVTARDDLTIDESRDRLWQRVQDFAAMETEAARRKYGLGEDVRDWMVAWAQDDLNRDLTIEKLRRISYRPFDTRWTYYTGRSRGFMCYPRNEITQHLVADRNMAMIISRQAVRSGAPPVNVLVTEHVFDNRGVYSNKGISQAAPLYLYPSEQDLDQSRRINFDPKLYARLQALATHPTHGTPDEMQVFDYIYGVLHCPAYRATYAEFLKIDFPRIPWPASPDAFWDVAAKGTMLRKLHLMDPAAIGPTPYPFRGEGDAMVEAPRYADGKVWINRTQYFADVPGMSWTFFIGGYQPAQKWLKDRKGRALSFDDVKHYQKIIRILAETDRIMQTITLTRGTSDKVKARSPVPDP